MSDKHQQAVYQQTLNDRIGDSVEKLENQEKQNFSPN